jgi:hypothetical protein
MLSHEAETLADNPALYLQLDMVGAATNGDAIPDKSGNSLDGALTFLGAAIEPYGYLSAVETEPLSKAFYGNNNTSGSPFPRASILVDHDTLISPSGDFTLRGFIKFDGGASHTPQMYFGKGSGNPITNNNCFFIGTDVLTQRIVGGMWDSANNFWSVTDSTYIIDPTVFYFVTLKRVGNALVLGINGVTTAITTITSGLATRQEPQPFFVHCPQTSPMTAFTMRSRFTLTRSVMLVCLLTSSLHAQSITCMRRSPAHRHLS